ncbi:lantibiotic dehydratase [Virgisporangium aurantiacum]|uniref:Lantibiotic dehydratase n=1 Tax=Virgisporangium aurantiacum TaxID=175570 RepID=A0A8J4E6G8_9ACTN|nr:lantibiotic dehydratase [Virgisporangium aurantiacum]GIJ63219.1 lantibiotic dehydratase [Virgisporangium aurantiacum]
MPAANDPIELPGTGWRIWPDALLRTTGFPADGLQRLAAPDAAAAADAHLAGALDEAGFTDAFAKAAADASRELYEIAGDPRFVEAITWQNTNVLHALDGLRADGPDGRRNYKRRNREEIVARYWQRYCAKNDTIGFFGPMCWVTIDGAGPAVSGGPGPGFLTDRRVYLERWALAAYAERLAADPRVRPWLPVVLEPHLLLCGREVRRPVHPPLPLSAAEAAALAALPRPRRAVDLADDLVADAGSGLRKPADVYLLLDRLVERGILRWGADLPMDLSAGTVLRAVVEDVGDPALRRECVDGLDRLEAARDAVAAAAGEPAELRAALAALDGEFAAVVGTTLRHGAGETYAGRALCHEDTVRDLNITFGGDLLAAIAPALDILLRAARWLTAAIAEAYESAFRQVYEDLCDDLGTREVPFGDLRYLAYGLLFGADRPVSAVTEELARRWAGVFDLADVAPGTRRLTVASADLVERVGAAFPADRPGWSYGRLHSPDLQIAAPSLAALARGEFTVVLGELHAACLTCSSAIWMTSHPDPEALRRTVDRDLGAGRVKSLFPENFPRLTARIADLAWSDRTWQLAYEPAPGADPDRLIPATALTVSDVDGRLVARRADGATWPLIELFGEFLSIHASDAFKLVSAGAHTPRITVDRFTVARETWRCTVGETGLAAAKGYQGLYLAARRWRAALGLPERVFVRLGTEIKPTYLDFTSPALVSSFGNMVRRARADGGDDVSVVLTELLPTPEDTWVPDADGRRYYSELRMTIRDPVAAPGSLPEPGERGQR